MRKKFITGAAVLALLMNAPQVSADDDIVIFGGEFEDEASAPKQVEKPKPVKETPPPVQEPQQPTRPLEQSDDLTTEPTQPLEQPDDLTTEPTQPLEQPDDLTTEPTQPLEQPDDLTTEPTQPLEQPDDLTTEPTQPLEQPDDLTTEPTQPLEQPDDLTTEPTQPLEQPDDLTTEPTQPLEQPDDLTAQPQPIEPLLPPTEIERPFEQPSNISGDRERIDEPTNRRESMRRRPAQPQKELQLLKPRFIKLAADDTYTYYLDKNSVQWKRMPYMANEYMADVWIRMIEHKPAALDDDMAYYGAENFRTEVEFAREQGYQYPPEDLKVLRRQAYVLEHYYLRPKTKQIQFLCELEVFGRPQNTINERAYDYKNWESLVPGSVESSIYAATIKIIGKWKASGRGHMTFIDMIDEYARIALN